MISIDETVYRETAARLSRRLEGRTFFNGRVEYDSGAFASALVCTLVLERDPDTGALRDAVPVWWEYRLRLPEGEAVTDFSWSELKRRLVPSV